VLVLAKSAAPLVVFNLLQFSLSAISVANVGRTGSLNMAAAALGSSFTNVAGVSLLVGVTSSLETTSSQAFGARAYASIGVGLQRTWFANLYLSFFITAIWLSAGPIFRLCRQDPQLSDLAAAYARALIPRTWLIALQYPLQKSLQAQGVMRPFGVIGLLLLAFHSVVSRLMVIRYGYLGAARATTLTDSFMLFLGAAVFIHRERSLPDEQRTWHGLKREALTGWGPFVRLAAPSCCMLIVEWGTFEAVTLLSGLLPGADTGAPTAASSIAITTIMCAFAVPLGFANACSSRVGAALGAGQPAAARASASVATGLALCAQAFVVVALALTGGGAYGRLFVGGGSEGHAALSAFKALVPCLSILVLGDGLQCVLSGAMRGAGCQAAAARINLVVFFMWGLPAGVLLAFPCRVGLLGLWVGLCLATNTQWIGLSVFLARLLDWQQAADQAQARSSEPAMPPPACRKDAPFGVGEEAVALLASGEHDTITH